MARKNDLQKRKLHIQKSMEKQNQEMAAAAKKREKKQKMKAVRLSKYYCRCCGKEGEEAEDEGGKTK
jgi:hypothetical protein